jgi:hypothetical protein
MNRELNSLALKGFFSLGKLFLGLGWIVKGIFSIFDRNTFPFITIFF